MVSSVTISDDSALELASSQKLENTDAVVMCLCVLGSHAVDVEGCCAARRNEHRISTFTPTLRTSQLVAVMRIILKKAARRGRSCGARAAVCGGMR
jgi:hypothetical protein